MKHRLHLFFCIDSIFPEPMFHAAPTVSKMTVLYYDHPANLEKAITANPKPVNAFRNAVLVAAVLEPDGTVKRQLACGLKDRFTACARRYSLARNMDETLQLVGKSFQSRRLLTMLAAPN